MLYLIPINDPDVEESTTYYTLSTGRNSSWRKDKKILKEFLTGYGIPTKKQNQVLRDLGFTSATYHNPRLTNVQSTESKASV